jgi:hypothetical protein
VELATSVEKLVRYGGKFFGNVETDRNIRAGSEERH